MKYLDEFRDGAKAGFLLKEIEGLTASLSIPDDRPLQIMEVCGGHTHSIFRYGVEGMLPRQIELVHGPGCPVCVLPMGRVDDCVAIAEAAGVIFTTFGDAMRVPGSRKSLLQAKADGADVRMVYSPMDALTLAHAESRPRGRFLRPRLRDHDAVDGADRAAGRSRGNREFLGLLQSHHHRADHQGDSRQPGSAARRLPRPRPRLDGDRDRALRVHRPLLSQADGRRRLRAARRAAVDLDGAEADQGGPRRDRKSIRPRRAGRGQRAGADRRLAGLRAARILRMARPGLDRSFGRQAPRAPTPVSTPSGNSPFPTSRSPIRKPASAAKCSRASSSRGSARCSARPARRRRRSAR